MKRIRKHLFLSITACLIILFGFTAWAFKQGLIPEGFLKYGSSKSRPELLEDYAQIVLRNCKTSAHSLGCYDSEIPKLMDPPYSITMEEAFEVTKIVQKKNPKYLYCHVLGHNISAKEERKDPGKWKDIIPRCPATMCNNGCVHGSVMARYQSETLNDAQINKLIPELKTVCEPRKSWNPVPIERNMCIHALGHLSIYVTNADIRKSVEMCDKITANHKDSLDCKQGVFMSLYQPLDPDDLALVKYKTPKAEDVASFCDKYKYDSEAWSACRRESWPLFYGELQKPEGAVKFCSYSDDPQEKKLCYNHVLHIVTILFLIREGDPTRLSQFCNKIPKPFDGLCYGSAAIRLVQIDPQLTNKAINTCKIPVDQQLQNYCFKMLIGVSISYFHPESSKDKQFCNVFPDQWKDICHKVHSTKHNLSNYSEDPVFIELGNFYPQNQVIQ